MHIDISRIRLSFILIKLSFLHMQGFILQIPLQKDIFSIYKSNSEKGFVTVLSDAEHSVPTTHGR